MFHLVVVPVVSSCSSTSQFALPVMLIAGRWLSYYDTIYDLPVPGTTSYLAHGMSAYHDWHVETSHVHRNRGYLFSAMSMEFSTKVPGTGICTKHRNEPQFD